jgi:hypothetical protein
MSLAGQRELELKVELTRDQLQRMRWHPALGNLAAGEPVTRNLRSIYYDTPDHRLKALGISLRLRSDGQSWLQTVKVGTDVRRGYRTGTEIAVAARSRLGLINARCGARSKAIGRPRAGVRDRRRLRASQPVASSSWLLTRAPCAPRAPGRCAGGLELKSEARRVPAADRRKSVRGPSRTSLQRSMAGYSLARPWACTYRPQRGVHPLDRTIPCRSLCADRWRPTRLR